MKFNLSVLTILCMISIVLMPNMLLAVDVPVENLSALRMNPADSQSSKHDGNVRSDIYVPANYFTIQAGIDAAIAGDTIWVSDGTYTGAGNKDLDFGGRNITVRSIGGDPAACIIDCENSGRGFYFHSGETNNAVVLGFTIQNGFITGGSWPDNTGGGININNASPTISLCTISNNTADVVGGISSSGSTSTIITNCVISGNTGTNNIGGLHCDDTTSVLDCTITGNSTPGDSGGGIQAWALTRVENCLISGNVADNLAGGIIASDFSQIINCRIIGNEAREGGGVWASIDAVLTNCEISGNTASDVGGGIYTGDDYTIVLSNCTITGNTATNYGGGIYVAEYGEPQPGSTLTDSIVWGNSAGTAGNEIYDPTAYLTVQYSNVQGSWPGTGNIDSDPLFQTGPYGDYTLSQIDSGQLSDSPCVDTGSDLASNICWDSGAICLDVFTTRTDTRTDTGQVDMGYHYYTDLGPCIHHGDVDFNGQHTAGDAQLAFNIALTVYMPTFEEGCAADCDGGGTVTAGDAQTIFGAIFGMGNCVDPI